MINSIYLVSFLSPSGPINQALNLLAGFDKREVNAIIVTLFSEKKESWIDRFKDAGIEVIQLKSTSFAIISARRELIKIIKERKIAIVHASGVRAVIIASLLPDNVKTVITARSHMADLEEMRSPFVNKIMQFVFKTALKRITRLTSCSKSLASDLYLECGLNFKPIPNGVDTDKFFMINHKGKQILKSKLEIPFNKIIFISCAVLCPRKNMSLIINSFNYLKRNDYILLIVGEGEEKDKLQELAKNNPNIIFTGKRNNVQEYYQVSDIFISSSLAEGLPNSVLEAMACGLPCILSKIGSHEEILDYANDAGMLLSLDKKLWTEEIEKAFTWDLEKRSQIARNLIDNHLSKQIMAKEYTNLYLSIFSAL